MRSHGFGGWAPASLLAAAALAAALAGAQPPGRTQSGGALGPADGAGLPATDPNRVAVGTVAPDFTLETSAGGRVTLSGFRGRKHVVLVFYRGHW